MISSAALQILFIRPTHSIWWLALISSVTPLRFGHLPGKKLHPVLRGFLHLDKIFLQFAGDQQVGIENSTVFFEIAQPYAVFSDWASFLLRR